MCPLHNVVPKRQRMVDGDVNAISLRPRDLFDYLTLYTPSGKVLARSVGHEPEEDIVLNYRGLNFICSPGYEDAVIALDWFSLVNWADDCQDDDEIIVELMNEMMAPEEIQDAITEDEEAYFYGG